MSTQRFVLLLLLGAAACAPRTTGGVAAALPPQLQTRPSAAIELALPLEPSSVRFAVIGDSGTGDREQYELARIMAESHRRFPFTFVLMLGDNIYGSEEAGEFIRKFERPYQPLLEAGVKFYASLGNHDEPNQRYYKHFNMNGRRYYSFSPEQGNVRFFALDSEYMSPEQIAWIERELQNAAEEWKICFFHHPIYSSGERHGSDQGLRRRLEPLFVKAGVAVVFSGHDHVYERIKPQSGIHYFVSGAAGKLRRGNIGRTTLTAGSFDRDLSFMMVEIADRQLHFQVVSRTGHTVDAGTVARPDEDTSTSR